MTQTQKTESLEIELKFEAPDTAELPGSESFSRIGLRADAPTVHELSAVYFDTLEDTLSSAGVAVRRRRGGADEGWHVKQRTPEGTREFHWPLAEAAPIELFTTLDAMVGDVRDRLEPRATLNTTRRAVQLRHGTGDTVIELADDRVRSQDHRTDTHRAWREWEAELAPTAEASWLTKVEDVLAESGARRSLSIAKIARASGQLTDLAITQGYSASDLAAIALIDLADRMAGKDADGQKMVGREMAQQEERMGQDPDSVPDPRCAELRNIAGFVQANRR